jgi:hypothetical protein
LLSVCEPRDVILFVIAFLFETYVGSWHIAAQSQSGGIAQLAKADFASSSRRVRDGQGIAALEAEIEALQRQARALGAEPTADVLPWVLLGSEDRCPPRARCVG